MSPTHGNLSPEESASMPNASPEARKRPNESGTTPSKPNKRRKSEHQSAGKTAASERPKRTSIRGGWDYGTKRTLEDEFKEIVEGAATKRQRTIKKEDVDEESPNYIDEHETAVIEGPTTHETTQDGSTNPQPTISSETNVNSNLMLKKENNINGSSVKAEVAQVNNDRDSMAGTGRAAAKDNHVILSSEEPSGPSLQQDDSRAEANQPVPVIPDTADEDDESSDDEAPEAVTKASALAQAKAVMADATRAAERLKAEEKQKRRNRDTTLKEQARLSRKNTKALRQAERARSTESEAFSPSSEDKQITEPQALPDLLPESLLARAGDVRPPTPERTIVSEPNPELETRKQHIKFIEQGDRPIKDVRKGPVNVRVLSKKNALMAPKSKPGGGSRNLREFMLQGRHGNGSAKKYAKVARTKVGGGFLRG